MSAYPMPNNVQIAEGFYNYIDEYRGKTMISQIYKRMPLITYMAGKYGEKGMLRGAGTYNVIGKDNFRTVEQGGSGEHDYRVDIHKAENTIHKTLGVRDTMPNGLSTSGQDQELTQAVFRYHHFVSEIKAWRSTFEAANGSSSRKAAFTGVYQHTLDSAMESHLKELNTKLYRGAPMGGTLAVATDGASADRMAGLSGVTLAMSDTLAYGNVTRSATTYFDGKFDTTARGIDGDGTDDTTNANIFTLIDYANIELGCQDISDGIDLVITSRANFRKAKRFAQNKNNYQVNDQIPEFSKYGISQECLKYGNVVITYDPYLQGSWATGDLDRGLLQWNGTATYGGQTVPAITDASKLVYMFNTESWAFHTMPGKTFSLTSMEYQGTRPGGEDCFSGFVETAARLICHKPGANAVFTNVS